MSEVSTIVRGLFDIISSQSNGKIWTDGEELLVKTESEANIIADFLQLLGELRGEEILPTTGYYDPEEDKRNGEEDKYTGWWYVDIN